jgi:hypothetical protein
MIRKSILLLAILGLSILYNPLCLQLCPSDQKGLDFIQDVSCSISSHSVIYIGTGLSTIFPLVGLIPQINITSIPEEFVFPLFRPPRFPS